MPFATVHLHAGSTTAQDRRNISDAIHEALKETLGIPDDDRFHTFTEYEDGYFFHEDVVFGLPRDNRLMLVSLSFNDRSAEVKAELFRALVRRMAEHAGVTSDRFAVRIVETARENWWADGRVVNPETGYDERMTVPGNDQGTVTATATAQAM